MFLIQTVTYRYVVIIDKTIYSYEANQNKQIPNTSITLNKYVALFAIVPLNILICNIELLIMDKHNSINSKQISFIFEFICSYHLKKWLMPF